MAGKTTHLRRWTLESELGQEKKVVGELVDVIRETKLEAHRADEIASAVAEACLNAIEHGNGCVRTVPVEVTMLAKSDRLVVRVCDRGPGTDAIKMQRPSVRAREKLHWDNPRGWGLLLMREYADLLRTLRLDGGFCVELHFYKGRDCE